MHLLANINTAVKSISHIRTKENDRIFVGGKDGMLHCWIRNNEDGPFVPEYTHKEATSPIHSTAVIQPSDIHPSGLVVTGEESGLIQIHTPAEPEKSLYTLLGHTHVVSTLAIFPDGRIVSGSWDKTAIIWHDWQAQSTLDGHGGSVLGVAVTKSQNVITGCADKMIRIWADGACVSVFDGGIDCVREIRLLSDELLVCCNNDSLVRVFSLDKQRCVSFLAEHDAYVYAVDVYENVFCTGSEDETICVWTLNGLKARLSLGATIWTVCFVGPSLLAAGCADGAVYLISLLDLPVSSPTKDDAHWPEYSFQVTAGEKALLLECSRGESIDLVAEHFLTSNDLPASFKEQIVGFVSKNTPQDCFCGKKATCYVSCCADCLYLTRRDPATFKDVNKEKMLSFLERSSGIGRSHLEELFLRICQDKCTEKDRKEILLLQPNKSSLFAWFDFLRMAVLSPSFFRKDTSSNVLDRAHALLQHAEIDFKLSMTMTRFFSNALATGLLLQTQIDYAAEVIEMGLCSLKGMGPALVFLHNADVLGCFSSKITSLAKMMFEYCTHSGEVLEIKKMVRSNKKN
eukprot:GHVN01008142.1.p2 GENE.GHVN01008142.1~~GHVN01008142.1.p2  ORF type:complete len:572 (-),score=55.64 GHVN01008142.1:3291-5006(-)